MSEFDMAPPLNADLSVEVWQVLGLQQEQKYEEAIQAWEALNLPPEANVWKHVALGQAYLASGNLMQAELELRAAREARADNAIVHYLQGILCLERAHRAVDWPDTQAPRMRLVSSQRDLTLKPKCVYELEAIAELETALAHSADVWLDEPLVPCDVPTQSALEPTVRDLLLAMGADNFEGKACNTLGTLFLERGALEIAEQYMDEAVARGMVNDHGYLDLAAEYKARDQFANATRAYWKSVTRSATQATAARDLLFNLWDALRAMSEKARR
jgi:tetratricopeptide (TPR) repeat protein